jgi:hypothetical protein
MHEIKFTIDSNQGNVRAVEWRSADGVCFSAGRLRFERYGTGPDARGRLIIEDMSPYLLAVFESGLGMLAMDAKPDELVQVLTAIKVMMDEHVATLRSLTKPVVMPGAEYVGSDDW